MPVATEVDEVLRTAIMQKHLIEFVYKGLRRIVEPHDYGVHKGSVKLLGNQLAGASSGPLPAWRWFEIDLITDIGLLNRGRGRDHPREWPPARIRTSRTTACGSYLG